MEALLPGRFVGGERNALIFEGRLAHECTRDNRIPLVAMCVDRERIAVQGARAVAVGEVISDTDRLEVIEERVVEVAVFKRSDMARGGVCFVQRLEHQERLVCGGLAEDGRELLSEGRHVARCWLKSRPRSGQPLYLYAVTRHVQREDAAVDPYNALSLHELERLNTRAVRPKSSLRACVIQ